MKFTNYELKTLINLIEMELEKPQTMNDEFYINLLTKLVIEYCKRTNI